MTDTTFATIILVYPPPTTPAQPPSSLAEAMEWVADGSTTRKWRTPGPDAAASGSSLPDRLEQLSARFGTTHFFCPDATRPEQLKALIKIFNARRCGLRLCLCCNLEEHLTTDFDDLDPIDAVICIQWYLTGPMPDFRLFRSFSKVGVWNHLVLDGVAASAENEPILAGQPNLIHSWETTRTPDRGGPLHRPYGTLGPLPGRPLWQVLTDPIHRFLIVDRFGSAWLSRARLDNSGNRIYNLGQALAYHFCPPDQLPPGYLDQICAMVTAGGSVAATHVRSNLERAFLIGYVLEKGMIVGNSSLKNPRAEYIDAVRHQSGLDLTGFVERGYTSVRPEYRGLGIGTKLLEGLTARAGDRKIFSVIAEDNPATQTIAIRNRTRKMATYFSAKAGKQVGIWMPEWMIDAPNGKGR